MTCPMTSFHWTSKIQCSGSWIFKSTLVDNNLWRLQVFLTKQDLFNHSTKTLTRSDWTRSLSHDLIRNQMIRSKNRLIRRYPWRPVFGHFGQIVQVSLHHLIDGKVLLQHRKVWDTSWRYSYSCKWMSSFVFWHYLEYNKSLCWRMNRSSIYKCV